MNMRKSLPWPMKLFSIFGLIVLLSSSVSGSNASVAYAQDPTPPAPNGDVQPLAANGSSLYYYVDGQRVNLTPSLDWVSVKFVSADTVEQQSVTGTFSSTVAPLDGAREIPHLGLTLLPLQDGLGTKTLVQGVNSMRASSSSFSQVNPVYSYDGVDMVVSDEFIAAFPLEAGMEDIDALNAARGVEMVSPILGQENTFVLRVTSAASLDALAMANHYQESGIALYAAPNFVRIAPADVEAAAETPSPVGPMFVPNDSYYATHQWYLNSTGQFGATVDADIDAPEAWNITKGNSSIIIAIIDEGVDLSHPELSGSGKIVTGYDATGLGSDGAQAPLSNDSHGTKVAGIAAAVSNNSAGISGVCQLCKIMPIRIAYREPLPPYDWIYEDAWAANGIALAYLNGASVLNNSWGGGSGATVVNTAITNAVTLGRGGKGAVVVAAAGNENLNNVSWPASLSNVISVGALNLCDQRKNPNDGACSPGVEGDGGIFSWGSNYGADLDVMAAGVRLTTTDLMGDYGDSNSSTTTYGADYTGYMNGTSGATPIVSGVVGLMLSVNTNMTPAHVQEILQRTTDNIGAAGWDEVTGYGRVNAFNAVTKAQMADLVITGFEYTSDAAGLVPLPLGPVADETFYIKIFVKNRGGTDAPAFYRSVYFEDHFSQLSVAPPSNPDFLEGCLAGPAPVVGDYYPPSLFGGITAGSSDNGLVIVEVNGGLSLGSHTLRLYADPLCLVDEAVEDIDNNDFGPINLDVGSGYFDPKATKWTSALDLSHGWTVKDFVRTVGDVDGDGDTDLVGFGLDGVYVALSNGTSFSPAATKWTSALDLSHGWTVQNFVRTVGDVDGDGDDDLVGFGLDGVYVALSNGTSFSPNATKWTSALDLSHGWTVKDFVRTVGDVDGDGDADLIGFGLDGVYVALSNGSSFSPTATKWTSALDLSHGWTVANFARTVGDVNGDGKVDLVGFGLDGVYVALSNGSSFAPNATKWTSALDLSHGWTVASFVRTVGDANGDGKMDLVGFGLDGVYVALSNGTSFEANASKWTSAFDLSHGWTVAQFVRTVGDVNNDGKADLVGFGLDGVYVGTAK